MQHDRSQVPARCTNLLEPCQGTEEGLDVGFQLKATERAADVKTSGVALYNEEQAPRHRGRTSVSGRWMRPARRLGWEIRSGKVFFSICACMAQMGAYIAGPILVAPWLPGDGFSATLALHSAAGFLYPCLVHTGHGG